MGENKLSNVADTLYKKLRSDGRIDNAKLDQSDQEQVIKFIKSTFPQATRVQKELTQQELKRTFIFGRAEKVKKNDKSLGSKAKTKNILSQNKRLKLQQHIPKRLEYVEFLHLNTLWTSYIKDLCNSNSNPVDVQAKLNHADLHGALVTVVHSNCKAYEDISGIIIKETRNTFVIVTKSNMTKTIPKPETVFDVKLEYPEGVMRIAGNSFLSRSAERSSKKVKSFMNFVGHKVYKSKFKYDRIEPYKSNDS